MQYRDAAELSARFIRSQLFDGNIIKDGIALVNCSHSHIILTYNSGYYIEGLAVYVYVTNSSEWTHLYVDMRLRERSRYSLILCPSLHRLINSSVKYSQWTGYNGIINEGNTYGAFSNPAHSSFGFRSSKRIWQCNNKRHCIHIKGLDLLLTYSSTTLILLFRDFCARTVHSMVSF